MNTDLETGSMRVTAKVEGITSTWEMVPFISQIPAGAFLKRIGKEGKEWYEEYWGTPVAREEFKKDLSYIKKLIPTGDVGGNQGAHPETIYFIPIPFPYNEHKVKV